MRNQEKQNPFLKKSSNKKRKWTKEEDQKMIEMIGEKDDKIDWGKISTALNLTERQCSDHWHNTLDPKIVKSLTSEDKNLISQYELEYGNAEIAKLISKKHYQNKKRITTTQVRDYINRKNSGIYYNEDGNKKTKKWSKKENECFKKLTEQYDPENIDFEIISVEFKKKGFYRTPRQCWDHWYNVLDPTIKKKLDLEDVIWILILKFILHKNAHSDIANGITNLFYKDKNKRISAAKVKGLLINYGKNPEIIKKYKYSNDVNSLALVNWNFSLFQDGDNNKKRDWVEEVLNPASEVLRSLP